MRARKRFGQHFLEPAWAERLVAAVGPAAADVFLEVGPGRGALTVPLARVVSTVTAVEIDRDLVAWLSPRLPSNVRLVEGDILDTPIDRLVPAGTPAGSVRVVGNLPYNLSSPILFWLLAAHLETGLLRDATVMLQREVAERVAAAPGSKTYGILSIFTQLDADVVPVLALPPSAFRPVPQVASAVVQLRFRAPAAAVRDRVLFGRLVRSIFAQRRKTVGNALKPLASARGVSAVPVLRDAGIDPIRRPETLGLVELAALADRLAAASG